MSIFPLLTFVGVLVIFFLATWYIFSRTALIRLSRDAAGLMMGIHVVAATLIIVLTILFLLR
jgi:hypothetical protein